MTKKLLMKKVCQKKKENLFSFYQNFFKSNFMKSAMYYILYTVCIFIYICNNSIEMKSIQLPEYLSKKKKIFTDILIDVTLNVILYTFNFSLEFLF